jgi:hypothetical protein
MTMLMAAQEIVDTFSAKGISVTFN